MTTASSNNRSHATIVLIVSRAATQSAIDLAACYDFATVKHLLFIVLAAAGLCAQAVPRITSVVNLGGGSRYAPGGYGFIRGTAFGQGPRVFLGGVPCQTVAPGDTGTFFQIPRSVAPGANVLTVQTDTGTSPGRARSRKFCGINTGFDCTLSGECCGSAGREMGTPCPWC
jgi:hypothetical protein